MRVLQVKLWEEKVKALVEERLKLKTAFESELRTLKVSQDNWAHEFDASLLALQQVSL